MNVNPKNHKTGDCSTRALVTVLGITYQEALKEQFEAASKKFYGITDRQTLDMIMEKYGYIKMKQPRKPDNKKYTVKELDQITSTAQRARGVLVGVANHWVAVKDYDYVDIWNSGDKSVGNYWVRKS